MCAIFPGNSEAAVAGHNDTPPPVDIGALFSKHHEHVLRFVKRYVRNDADAEDVLQNTFIEAVRCADRFSGLSKPSTWLFGIALNLAHNQVRRNTADMSEAAEESFFDGLMGSHANPAVVVEQRQTATHIERLLSEMPKKIRDTFLIVLEGDCTYEQAAEQMQVPIGTIRSRVSRVRNTIRNRFDENCPAPPVTKSAHQKKARHCDALLAISTTASSKTRSL